jgi:hypothetical protein
MENIHQCFNIIAMDKRLLREALAQDMHAALKFLYGRYSGMLFSHILAFMPNQEKSEEVFLELFSHIGTREQLEDALHSPVSLYCWLQAQARHLILTRYAPFISERISCYSNLLQYAPSQQKAVFSAIYLHGKSTQEVATELGEDENTIKTLLMEALRTMHQQLHAA